MDTYDLSVWIGGFILFGGAALFFLIIWIISKFYNPVLRRRRRQIETAMLAGMADERIARDVAEQLVEEEMRRRDRTGW